MKCFASTTSVAPMFVFISSNERLFTYKIPANQSSTGLPLIYQSHADLCIKKKMSKENLTALKSRFLELFACRAPVQEKTDLERAGNFSRHHFILGCFEKAIQCLDKYKPEQFYSVYLFTYVLAGLRKNLDFYEENMCSGPISFNDSVPSDCPFQHRKKLENLEKKFGLTTISLM